MNASADPPRRSGDDAGEYRLLHKYLKDRFADRLVLTFAQIEDIMGFLLPESARLDADWWSGTDAAGQRTKQGDAWRLAGRSAIVNLSAQYATFEREATPAPARRS